MTTEQEIAFLRERLVIEMNAAEQLRAMLHNEEKKRKELEKQLEARHRFRRKLQQLLGRK